MNKRKTKDKTNPRIRRSLIAYIDILGFSEIIKLTSEQYWNEDELLKEIIDKIETAIDGLKDLERDGVGLFNSFSDNIVIGVPISTYPGCQNEICIMIYTLRVLQLSFVLSNMFIRGAFILDDIYIAANFAYGTGLIRAYNIENKEAIEPKIVVKDELEHYLETISDEFGPMFYKDNKGDIFINYLQSIIANDSGDLYKLEQHKELVEKNIEKFKNQTKELIKYYWVANYHNAFCNHNRIEDKYNIEGITSSFQPLSNNPEPW